jgi:hypothetical protein
MGVNMRKNLIPPCKIIRNFALPLLLLPGLAQAQFIGYTTAQSVTQKLFTNHTGSGTSSVITNLGQSSHFITVCNNLFAGAIILESSVDGTFSPANNVVAANFVQQDSDCHLIQAGGYYPAMRVRIVSTTGQTTITYSGIGGPVAPQPSAFETIGPTSPISCDQSLTTLINPSLTGVTLITGQPGVTIIVCSVTLNFSAATTAGVISIGALASTPQPSGGGCTLGTPFGNPLFVLDTTSATPQTIPIASAGGLFRAITGNPVCISVGAIGANTLVNMSFAQSIFGEVPPGAVFLSAAKLRSPISPGRPPQSRPPHRKP